MNGPSTNAPQVPQENCIKGPPPPPTGPLEVITSSQNKAGQFGKQILKWTPPQGLDQCGAPLLGYCVEKRDTRKSTWTFLLRTKETQADVGEGLVTGMGYLFRVAAENKFGAGEALEMSQPFQVTQKGVGKELVQEKEPSKEEKQIAKRQRKFLSFGFAKSLMSYCAFYAEAETALH
ncbi:titin [Ditylenchus destructor]|uniref:Titin n=1 Tax=Ditylenchus destructor TaxID=166010 RepID=A0AAD4NB13_9BILA|nr:titin [Ditylenchus destructor]